MQKIKITVKRAPCAHRSGRHRWKENLAGTPIATRLPEAMQLALTLELRGDPALRICGHCGARGRVNKQGQVEYEPRTSTFENGQSSKVAVTPRERRASWARGKTVHDA